MAVAAAGAIAWRVAMHPPSIEFRPAPTVEAVVPPAPAVMTPSAPVVPPPVAAKPNVGPTFDVVRVEPTGEAVIAGRAAPGAHVRLLDQGQSIADGTADAAGQFVLMPVLAPGIHELTLAVDGSPTLASAQSVTVVVAANRTTAPLVALAAPGQATRVLSGVEAPKAIAAPQVFIKTVEATPEGRIMLSGTGSAGAALRLYLDDTPLANATADTAGAWSVSAERALVPKSYRVRADEVGRDGAVLARAEVDFDWAGPVPPAAAVASATEPPAKGQTVKVARGDSLWRISRSMFGAGRLYTQIYEANAKQIRDRARIYPGQVLVVPKS